MIQLYANLEQKIGRSKWFIKSSIFFQQHISFKTSMLRLHLCDYSDAYIVVTKIISVTDTNDANRRNKKLIFKNNAPFRSSITEMALP